MSAYKKHAEILIENKSPFLNLFNSGKYESLIESKLRIYPTFFMDVIALSRTT